MSLFFILFNFFTLVSAGQLRYNTSAFRQHAPTLNVHIVCHTHDDVGWLKTYTQYYYGTNNTYEPSAGGVQYILDTLVTSLAKNKDRMFSYVEQAFFQRWYEQQPSEIISLVQTLVSNGQLAFINGGWVMHDEAAAHFIGMLDQTTYGHTKLLQNFGYVPKVGWQIDPFGHSSTQADLLSAQVGFESLFFARIDYQDFQKRKAEKDLEFMWQASASNLNSSVFTGVFVGDGYGPPKGFCFDTNVQCLFSSPVIDDVKSPDYNVDTFVDKFVETARAYEGAVQGNDVMFLMGSDFFYDNAERWFLNLDKLIHYVNKDGRVNAFYSTPEMYAKAKTTSGLKFSVKTDDFFPYADNKDSYWTGYFTSRPSLKRLERVTSGFLQIARMAEVQAALSTSLVFGSPLDELERAIGILQHHDGVSGTSKQHVAYDYALRVSNSVAEADGFLSVALANLTQSFVPASFCHLLNETVCNITQTSQSFTVVLHNTLTQPFTSLVRFPVLSTNLEIRDFQGNLLPFQITNESIPLFEHRHSASSFYRLMLSFEPTLPPSGFSTFFFQTPSTISSVASEPLSFKDIASSSTPEDEMIVIENAYVSASFSTTSGSLVSFTNKEDNITVIIKQEWLHYVSAEPEFDGVTNQSSGAYIFRPSHRFPSATPVELQGGVPKLSVNKGAIVQEVRIEVNSWITQIVRLSTLARHLEVDMTVGPVPTEKCLNLCGLEVISRYSTDLDTGLVFHTDANGREMQKRTFNQRPSWNLTVEQPVAGNYYPVNVAASLRDSTRDLTVVVDRSVGAASLLPGQLEIMVHRRIHFDDVRGVTEFLDETEGNVTHWPILAEHKGPGLTIVTKHFLSLSLPKLAAPRWRNLALASFSPLLPAFYPLSSTSHAISDWIASHRTQQSYLQLPDHVSLVTFQLLSHAKGSAQVRVRLWHTLSIDEASGSLFVDLRTIFASQWPQNVKVLNVTETSLTGNQMKGLVPLGNVSLSPMQIRTFVFQIGL